MTFDRFMVIFRAVLFAVACVLACLNFALAVNPYVGSGSLIDPLILATTGNTPAALTFSGATPVIAASSTTATLDFQTVAGNAINGVTIEAPTGTTPGSDLALAGAAPLAFLGTAAKTISNAATATTTFNCSAAAATCYTFGSPASGLSDTVDLQASSGNGFDLSMAGSRAFAVAGAAPLLENTNAACTTCFLFDEKNAVTAGNPLLQINDNGNAVGTLFAGSTATASQLSLGGAADIAGAYANNSIVFNADGHILSTNSCNLTTSSKAATMNALACTVTVVNADIAGPIVVTYQAAQTFLHAPVCIVIPGSQWTTTTVIMKPSSSTTACTVTFSASVSANDQFNILVMGGN